MKLPSSPKSVPVSVSGLSVPTATPPAAVEVEEEGEEEGEVAADADVEPVVVLEERRTPYPLDCTSSSPSASHSLLSGGPICEEHEDEEGQLVLVTKRNDGFTPGAPGWTFTTLMHEDLC